MTPKNKSGGQANNRTNLCMVALKFDFENLSASTNVLPFPFDSVFGCFRCIWYYLLSLVYPSISISINGFEGGYHILIDKLIFLPNHANFSSRYLIIVLSGSSI